MTAIKSTSSILGVTYTIIDADSNEVILANGQPQVSRPLQAVLAGAPTVQLLISGTGLRMTQAQAQAWPYSAGQSFVDADGVTVSFAAAPPTYSGGTFESANSGGLRMSFKGLFCDFTSTNLTDLGTPLGVFGASGLIS